MGNSIKMIASIVPILSKNTKDKIRWHFYLKLSPRLATGSQVSDHYVIENWFRFTDLFVQKDHRIRISDINNRPLTQPNIEPLDTGLGYYYTREEWLRVYPDYAQDPDFYDCVDKLNTQRAFLTFSGNPGDERSKRRERLWKVMMNSETRVDPWLLNPVPYQLTDKLSAREVKAAIAQKIDDYVALLLGQEDPMSSEPGPTGYDRASLAAHLESLKQYDPDTVIKDPVLTDASMADIRWDLRKALGDIVAQWRNEIDSLTQQYSLNEVEASNQNETCEFHKKMSAYAHHPFLLKQTGWLFEFSVPLDRIGNRLQDKLFVQFLPFWADGFNVDDYVASYTGDLRPEELAMFFNELEFVYPLTFVVKLDGGLIDAGDMKDYSNMLNHLDYFAIDRGFLDVNDPRFTFIPSIVEKNQMLQRIDDYLQQDYSFSNRPQTNSDVNQQNRINVGQPLPAKDNQEFVSLNHEHDQLVAQSGSGGQNSQYISSGISLSVKDLGTAVRTVVDTNPETNSASANLTFRQELSKLRGTAVIFRHHLHLGYRIDVLSTDSNRVHSLSRREVLYDFKDENKNEYTLVDIDEGWMAESTQVSTQPDSSKKLLVDEELARWNDWSLVTSQLFKPVDDDGKDLENCSTLRITSFPFHQSLPRLRFGETYRFMVRTSDICGDGPTIQDSESRKGNPHLVTGALSYQRTEPINAPLVFLSEPLRINSQFDQGSLDKHMGEDIATLVIRSTVDDSGIRFNGQLTARWLGPPKEDFHFVKKHGVFEKFILEQQKRFKYHLKPLVNAASQELIRLSAQVKVKQANTTEKVVVNGQTIDYLFDPLIQTFIVIVDRKVVYPENPVFINKYNLDATTEQGYWKDMQYFAVRLAPYNKDKAEYAVEAGPNELTIKLAPGRSKTVALKCKSYDTLETLIREGEPKQRDALSLFYYKKTQHNTTRVQVIHAVQKPCLLGESPLTTPLEYTGRIDPLPRQPEDSSFSPRFSFDKFPCLTAETYLLQVYYQELSSDRTSKDIAGRGRVLSLVQKVVRTGFMPSDPNSQYNVQFNDLTHPFPNAKYRQVSYELEAVSKFKKYFPTAGTSGTTFSVSGKTAAPTTVPCSMQPPPLKISRIVPLLDWQEESTTTGKRVTSSCRSIRVYFEGDWWLTGDQEQVALFFIYGSKDYSSSNIEKGFEPIVSQLGADPASGNQSFKKDSRLNVVLDGSTITGGTPIITDPEMRYLDYEGKATHPNTSVPLKALAFDIDYIPPDENQVLGSYYIDITIDSDIYQDYFPFVRFALARYQPNSIGVHSNLDYRFSRVIVTDFVQLLPFRQLIIEPAQLGFAYIKQRSDATDKLTNIVRLVSCGGEIGPEDNTVDFGALYQLGEATGDYPCAGSTGQELEGLTKVVETWLDPVSHRSFSLTKVNFPLASSFKDFTRDALVFEEYEAYDWDRDLMEDFKTSPREDYRKRLIFTYTQTESHEPKDVHPGV